MINKTLALFAVGVSVMTTVFIVSIMQPINANIDNKKNEDVITLAAYKGDIGVLPYIAEKQKIFEKHNLKVEFKEYESGVAAADALLNGEADFATAAGGVFVAKSFQHPDLRVVSTIAESNSVGFIGRKSNGIESVEDIRGKKIGVTKETTGEFDLGIFLLFHNMTFEDIEVINLSPSQIVEKMQSGEIDGAFTWEPNLHFIENSLNNDIFVSKDFVPEFFFLMISTKSFLESKPEVTKNFVISLLEAESYIEENEENEEIVVDFMVETFDYSNIYASQSMKNSNFKVYLPQVLLLKLEDIGRWRLENNLSEGDLPYYLEFMETEILTSIHPSLVTLIQ